MLIWTTAQNSKNMKIHMAQVVGVVFCQEQLVVFTSGVTANTAANSKPTRQTVLVNLNTELHSQL